MTGSNTTAKAKGRSRAGKGGAKQSAARLAAVQALYQAELSGAAVETVLAEFLAFRLNEEVDGVSLAAADRGLLELLPGNVGYLELINFAQNTTLELRKAMQELRQQGATQLAVCAGDHSG